MKRVLKVSAVVAGLIVSLAVGQTPEPRQATLTVGSATIADLKGNVVTTNPQGQSVPAQRGQILLPESVVETKKGSAILSLSDGSQVLIKNGTRVTLKSPEGSKGDFLDLLIGKIMLQVRKRTGDAPSFKLGTPSAVITVRGTRFSVEVTKSHKTIVDVFEGLVDVAGLALQTEPVQVRPGFSTEVEPNRSPARPRSVGGAGNGTTRSDDGVFTPGMRREHGGGGSGGGSGGPAFESGDASSGGRPSEQQGNPSTQPGAAQPGEEDGVPE